MVYYTPSLQILLFLQDKWYGVTVEGGSRTEDQLLLKQGVYGVGFGATSRRVL